MPQDPRGLFVTGTDTGVGKTYVAALIARQLASEGREVGVYKPAESGCENHGGRLLAGDATTLWEAAGMPGPLEHVCPQTFAAPLAPHLAARAEGRCLDARLLRRGIDYWLQRSEVLLVEGAGGLMSPLGEDEYVADLATEFGFPLVIVTRNALGTINQTLQTLIAADSFGEGLPVAGIVLNHTDSTLSQQDVSMASNRAELERRCNAPLLAEVPWQAAMIEPTVDWFSLARRRGTP